MLFNSYTFLLFFVVVLFLSRVLSNWTARKLFLLAVSYVFYAAWDPAFTIILIFSTLMSLCTGKWIEGAKTPLGRKSFLALCLVVNLGMLTYFKYGNFIVDNLNYILAGFAPALVFTRPNIVIPIGISFYTFHTLSYIIDIYRGRLHPWNSSIDYALYVTFFPQLVAGPIVRAVQFLPQCESPRIGDRKQIGWGMVLFVIGLFTKVFLADELALPLVEAVYDSSAPLHFFSAWAGTLAFAVQIFCDFFGYSTCAIGIALCLGFELPENFRFPYAALGFSDFWRRWHISLSSWLRDYLYISMGGNKKGAARAYFNLAATMLLGGLWHGASWMFVIWGGLHGVYLIAERLIMRSIIARWKIWTTSLGQLFLILLTFVLVCITWVFFRAQNLTRAISITSTMLDVRDAWYSLTALLSPMPEFQAKAMAVLSKADYISVCVLTIALLASHYYLRNTSLEQFFGRLPWWTRSLILAAMISITFVSMSGKDRAFIYFQF